MNNLLRPWGIKPINKSFKHLIFKKKSRLIDIFRISLLVVALSSIGFLSSGCSYTISQKEQFAPIDEKIKARNFAGAILDLEKAKDIYYAEKDQVIYYLDLGMLYHFNGDYERSNEMLAKAETAIEYFYTESVSKAAASFILNDNVMDYSGEDYEDIYLNIFMALNYLELKKFDDAFVEIRKINNKLELLETKYKKVADEYNSSEDKTKEYSVGECQFHNSCLSRLLSLLLYRTEGKIDEARIDYDKIKEAWDLQSHVYNFPMPDFHQYLVKNGKAKVNFISLIGRSPEKFANNFTIHTFPNIVAIYQSDGQNETELDAIAWPEMEGGYHFKFSLPYMKRNGTIVNRVEVEVDGKQISELDMVEDIEHIAEETFQVKQPLTYLKTITRAVTKGLANEAANRELDKSTGGGFLGQLTRTLGSAIIDLSENPDLRLSRYFPAKAMAGEIELDPGEHNIKIKYYDSAGMLVFTDNLGTKKISSEGLNLIRSICYN